jgi:ubiquitin carboxyl-terminal hydrolase 4/11/15
METDPNKNESAKKENNLSTFTRTVIDINELKSVLKPGSNHGVCGGRNLGNTCFMNSSIACLSNCTELTTYFLTKKFLKDINETNKEGLGGRLAKAWYNLLEQYWNSDIRAGNPSEVKSCVAKKVRKFAGFSQQDSNEFMTEFLSLLSEDLNKTDKKEYKQLKEKGDNETDLECAKRFWNLHIKLNDSIVTDLFSGLLKSEVHCPNCKFINITFDPFNTLTLPIPSLRELNIELQFYYIPKYSLRNNCRFQSNIGKNCTFKELMEKIQSVKGFNYDLKNSKFKFMKVSKEKFETFLDENDTVKNAGFLFIFDNLEKEGKKNITIPLYLYKNRELSSFPQLLFLEEDNNYDTFKRKIYYLIRKYIKIPFKEDKFKVDEEIEKFINKEKEENIDELLKLLDKEYSEIFNSQEENIQNFITNFPYRIAIRKKFDDKNEICIFDGKNNLDNLKEFGISKDTDSICNLLNKIKEGEYFLDLLINSNSDFSKENINFKECKNTYEIKSKEGKLNLEKLLDYFCTREHLDKGNEWRCGNCNKHVEATKNFSIFYVPRLLIICLSRFSKRGYGYSKNDEYIDFPLENLDMGKYICGPDKDNSKYDLFAVSQHFGGTGGGHYTAVCRNMDGKWYDYNDSSCSPDSSSNVVSSSAYVLFYRRHNW